MINSAELEWRQNGGGFGMEGLVGRNNQQEREKASVGYSFQGSHGYGIQEGDTLILALEWPSWWLVLRGLGWRNIIVITKEKLKGKSFWKDSFRSEWKRRAWSEWLVTCRTIETTGGIVWLQGPSKFLVETLDLFKKYELGPSCVVMGSEDLLERVKPREGMFWNRLGHQDVGGCV